MGYYTQFLVFGPSSVGTCGKLVNIDTITGFQHGISGLYRYISLWFQLFSHDFPMKSMSCESFRLLTLPVAAFPTGAHCKRSAARGVSLSLGWSNWVISKWPHVFPAQTQTKIDEFIWNSHEQPMIIPSRMRMKERKWWFFLGNLSYFWCKELSCRPQIGSYNCS